MPLMHKEIKISITQLGHGLVVEGLLTQLPVVSSRASVGSPGVLQTVKWGLQGVATCYRELSAPLACP